MEQISSLSRAASFVRFRLIARRQILPDHFLETSDSSFVTRSLLLTSNYFSNFNAVSIAIVQHQHSVITMFFARNSSKYSQVISKFYCAHSPEICSVQIQHNLQCCVRWFRLVPWQRLIQGLSLKQPFTTIFTAAPKFILVSVKF